MAQLPTRQERDAFYFKHRSNSRMDPRIKQLISIYGATGYGWYWIIMEILRDQQNFDLNIGTKYFYEGLAGELNSSITPCNASQAKEFLQDCINEFQLFHMEMEMMFSEDLNADMAAMMHVSKVNKANAMKSVERRKQIKLAQQGAVAELPLGDFATVVPTVVAETLPNGSAKVQQQDKTIQNNTRQQSVSAHTENFEDDYHGLKYDLDRLKKGFPIYFNDENFLQMFEKFAAMRSIIKKGLHHDAAKFIMDRIVRYSQDRIQYAIGMLEKSITGNKPNVYPLDEDDEASYKPETKKSAVKKESRMDKFQSVSNAITGNRTT